MAAARKRLQSAETRQLLLETGKQLLVDAGTPERVDISLAEVISRSGRSTASAYQIWASQEAFQADLAVHLAETLEWAGGRAVGEAFEQALAAGTRGAELGGVVGQVLFEQFVAASDFFLTLPLYAVYAPRPEVVTALQQTFARLERQVSETLVTHEQQLGYRPAYDGAYLDFALAAIAVLDGASMQYRVSPDVFSPPWNRDHHPVALMWQALALYFILDRDHGADERGLPA